MQSSTKKILIGLGVVAVLGTGGWMIWRAKRVQAPPIPPLPPIPGQGLPPPRLEAPQWSEEIASLANAIIADEIVALGNPAYSPQVVVQIAFAAASEIWPHWNWPTNANQSNLFLQSNDPAVAVWSNLIAITQDQLGYRPIT